MDFFYVGYTENINFRYSQHLQNKGAVWTRRHKPIKLVEVICPGTKKLEDEITEKYMSIYGQGKFVEENMWLIIIANAVISN